MNISLQIRLRTVSYTHLIADKKKVKDNAIKRKKELLYDYSEVVSKLTLLLGAGMTTRMAWHKIAADYKDNIEHGKAVRRPVYDEICKTDYNIQAGISELKAYEQFGKRCDTREYMKLAALLQTNIRKGTKELRRLLEEETADAFEKRKNMAKIKCEDVYKRQVLAATVDFRYLIMTPVVRRPNITVVIKNIKVVITKGLVFFDFIVHHLYNN